MAVAGCKSMFSDNATALCFSSKRSNPLAFQPKLRVLWIQPESARINRRHGPLVARSRTGAADPSTKTRVPPACHATACQGRPAMGP